MKGGIKMKKMLLAFLSIPLVFTLSACTAKTTPTKAVENQYVAEKAELKDLPVYPDARLVYDQESSWGGEDSSYWGWIYVTTAIANEILDFFEKEFSNLGYQMTEKLLWQRVLFVMKTIIFILIILLGIKKIQQNYRMKLHLKPQGEYRTKQT